MKYAREVIELMSAYPGREFRMTEIVRYVRPGATAQEKHGIRRATLRVLVSLIEDAMSVVRVPPKSNGGFAVYRWRQKARHVPCCNRVKK